MLNGVNATCWGEGQAVKFVNIDNVNNLKILQPFWSRFNLAVIK